MRALFLSFFLLAGCTQMRVVPYERPAPIFPTPAPVTQQEYQWIVITPDNVQQVMQSLQGTHFVLLALTPEGYSALNVNMAELRRYIAEQQSVIRGYQVYVAPQP